MNKQRKGSVLVLTIAITLIIVSIGVSFASVIEKEVLRLYYFDRQLLASNITDVAWECTLYNAFQRRAFDFPTGVPTSYDVLCGTEYKAVKREAWEELFTSTGFDNFSSTSPKTSEKKFTIIASESPISKPCADVTVVKECITNDSNCSTDIFGNVVSKTTIFVIGYNSCPSDDSRGNVRNRLFITY